MSDSFNALLALPCNTTPADLARLLRPYLDAGCPSGPGWLLHVHHVVAERTVILYTTSRDLTIEDWIAPSRFMQTAQRDFNATVRQVPGADATIFELRCRSMKATRRLARVATLMIEQTVADPEACERISERIAALELAEAEAQAAQARAARDRQTPPPALLEFFSYD